MTNHCYVVMCLTGDGYDEYRRPILVVNTKEEAKQEIERLSASVPEYSEYLERLHDKVHDIAWREAEKVNGTAYSKLWEDVYNKVCEHFYNLIEKKYPHLTTDIDMSNAYYYYEKCRTKEVAL